MRKLLACLLGLMMAVAGLTHAQTSQYGGIRETTDPQRAEEIENKARQLSGQSTSETGATGTTGTAPDAKTDTKKATKNKKKKRSKSHKKSRKHASSGASTSAGTSSTTEKKTEEAQPTK